MKTASLDTVVAGHFCVDVIPALPDSQSLAELFSPGKLVNIGKAVISTGGPVSNTGLALIKLGMKTGLMAKIGDDFFGNGARQLLKVWGAQSTLTVSPGESTSYTIVLAPPGIDRIFLHHPGANDSFGSDNIDYKAVASARHFHLGYPPLMKRLYCDNGIELVDIFKKVAALGTTTSLDMSLPDPRSESGRIDWRPILSALLPYVDIALFSAEESMFMLNRARFDELREQAGTHDPLSAYTTRDFEWIGAALLASGAKISVVKCGYRGMLLFTGDKISRPAAAPLGQADRWARRALWNPAFVVEKIASATGSGDSSIAGFLAAFLRGRPPEECLIIGCCAGGQNVQAYDAISGIHSWDETLAMIPGWQKRSENPGAGWRFDAGPRLWRRIDDAGN